MSTKTHWHHIDKRELQEKLRADFTKGLSPDDAHERARVDGKNILEKPDEGGIIAKLIEQFKSPLVYILFGAGVVTLVLHEYLDAIVIAAALLINIIVGAFQEERASKAFEKLNQSQEQFAVVIRQGKRMQIHAEDLVKGDIVVLEEGFHVPADIRVLETKDLKINEAVLTGEWAPVTKKPDELPTDTPLAERYNMAWMGTLIASGSGRGVVVAVGRNTQVGEIAAQLGTIDESETTSGQQPAAARVTRVCYCGGDYSHFYPRIVTRGAAW